MFKCVYAWRFGDNWYYWGPHYGPSICKCANTAQGESKIVVSVLVTFRTLFKHVCKVSWCLIAYTWTSEQRLLSPKDLSTGRILNSLSVGVMWPYFLFPNSLTAKFWTSWSFSSNVQFASVWPHRRTIKKPSRSLTESTTGNCSEH